MDPEPVKVYIATHCTPCDEVKKLLEANHFLVDGAEGKVDLIDIETDEGFKAFAESLHSIDAVPSAYLEGKKCRILIDEETNTLLLECDGEDKRA